MSSVRSAEPNPVPRASFRELSSDRFRFRIEVESSSHGRRLAVARALLSKRLSDADAIRLFAEHHIVQVRRRRNGEIVAVKHCTFGWISPRTFYLMQEFHNVLPKIVEGGYRFKQAVWTTEINLELIASGATIPLGLLLVAAASLEAAIDAASGRQLEAALDYAALALPFGEFWIIAHARALDIGFMSWLWQHLADATSSGALPVGVPPLFVGTGFFQATIDLWKKLFGFK